MAIIRVEAKAPTVGIAASIALVAGLLGLSPQPARAASASASIAIRDNAFTPPEVRIDPGDSVIWNYEDGQNTHTVTSDERGQFDSGDMSPSGDQTFSHTFTKVGYYPYFCRLHGARGGVGMAGLIMVGDPPGPPPGEERRGDGAARLKLVVPRDFPTIQQAVDAARTGSTVLVRPGVYREAVTVKKPGLVIRGLDRFRTVLHGDDSRESGIVVDGVENVRIKNLTVRNYLQHGISFDGATGYLASGIDSIKNRTYGIHVFNSYDGVVRNSFGWGSGDSGFYLGHCLGCSALIENVHSEMNYLGYSGTNATGVIIRGSTFTHNGAGMVPNTLPREEGTPNRGTTIVNNRIINNNYESIPAAGLSESIGIPFGTGIWFAGVQNNLAKSNLIRNHNRYGVLITQSMGMGSLPINNRVRRNVIRSSGTSDLAYDGTGYNNCFYRNDRAGPAGPTDVETLYSCPDRPNVGIPFAPVQADVAANMANTQTREQMEPPEPDRPSCQRGAAGCDR